MEKNILILQWLCHLWKLIRDVVRHKAFSFLFLSYMDVCLLVLVRFMPAIDNFFVFNETWWKSIRLLTYNQRNKRANKKNKYGLTEMTLFVSVPTFYIFGYKVYLINESKKMRFKTKRIMPIFINSVCVCVVELMLRCCSPSWSFSSSFSFSLCMCILLLGTSCTK